MSYVPLLSCNYHTLVKVRNSHHTYSVLVARGRARFVLPTRYIRMCRNQLTWALTRFGDEKEERFHCLERMALSHSPSLSPPTTLRVVLYLFPVVLILPLFQRGSLKSLAVFVNLTWSAVNKSICALESNCWCWILSHFTQHNRYLATSSLQQTFFIKIEKKSLPELNDSRQF